jgi:hypothetical protein
MTAFLPIDMRKNKCFKMDERLLSFLDTLAEGTGTSTNNYLETLIFHHCQGKGLIPFTEQPPVGGKGGKRTGAGRPKGKKEEPIEPEE